MRARNRGRRQVEKGKAEARFRTFQADVDTNIFPSDTHHHHGTWLERMFLKHIDLTTALRPSYLPDEVLLFVQDNVGLYEGYAAPAFSRLH